MYKNGKVDFEAKHELFRTESEQGRALTNLEYKHQTQHCMKSIETLLILIVLCKQE